MKRTLLAVGGTIVALLLILIPLYRILAKGEGGAGGADWRVAQLYGNGASVDCLVAPQSVDAFVLDPGSGIAAGPPLPQTSESPTVIGRYAALANTTSTLADAATMKELSEILLDQNTYDWKRAKSVPFRPTLGLRFVRDASRLEVAICFESNMVVAYRMGRFTGVEDMDAARPRLVAIAKRLFPNDWRFSSLR